MPLRIRSQLNSILFFMTLLVVQISQAGSTLPKSYMDFIQKENQNEYSPKTTVNERYRPGKIDPFPINYLEIPKERVVTLESQHYFSNRGTNPQSFLEVQKNGHTFVRFFIHPDSEKLYAPLIREFKFAGQYSAIPTSSTRTVLAWDPKSSDKIKNPIFLKLSLAQKQDTLGRVIPSWEVRRGLGVTQLISSLDQEEWLRKGAMIIPEYYGSYVKAEENLEFYVDKDQPEVKEHGFLVRDASFLERFDDKLVVPMFWLFSKRGKKPPLIIELWKKSGKNFYDFLDGYLISPFIELNSYLMFYQGIVPQIHGQNVLLVLNPKTFEIQKVLHRDIGSMKVDYRLRWMHGLSIESLRSPLADKDFGLSWGAEKIEAYYKNYFHDWLFAKAYKKTLSEYIPDFDITITNRYVHDRLMIAVEQYFGKALESSKAPETVPSITDIILEAINQSSPQKINIQNITPPSAEDLNNFIQKRRDLNQVVNLPSGWQQSILQQMGARSAMFTDYGLVFKDASSASLQIAFYAQDPHIDFTSEPAPLKALRCELVHAISPSTKL